jgi:hypothetical protein
MRTTACIAGCVLWAGAFAAPVNAITVTIDGRSLTAEEVCDARFVKDTPPYYRTTPTAVQAMKERDGRLFPTKGLSKKET